MTKDEATRRNQKVGKEIHSFTMLRISGFTIVSFENIGLVRGNAPRTIALRVSVSRLLGGALTKKGYFAQTLALAAI